MDARERVVLVNASSIRTLGNATPLNDPFNALQSRTEDLADERTYCGVKVVNPFV